MADDQIRYDILTQDALRGVVRKVLSEVARTGLPGEHHFFITFATHAPGVRVSSRLLTRYPEDMTIVLQHQFWDFTVNEHAFEVGLSFNGIPERLLVPFTAVKVFHDPSVQFGVQFEIAARPGQPKAESPRAIEDLDEEPYEQDFGRARSGSCGTGDCFRPDGRERREGRDASASGGQRGPGGQPRRLPEEELTRHFAPVHSTFKGSVNLGATAVPGYSRP